jgi:hypothetical protein
MPAARWDGTAIDPDGVRSLAPRQRAVTTAPPLIAWLVKVARANEGEGWGVDYLLDRGGFDGLAADNLQPRDFADLEEDLPHRIMREIVRLFGLEYTLRTPPWPIQQSVKLMAHLPQQAAYMLLLAGELMGTVAFAQLARQGEALLAGHPAIGARRARAARRNPRRRGRARHLSPRLDAGLAAGADSPPRPALRRELAPRYATSPRSGGDERRHSRTTRWRSCRSACCAAPSSPPAYWPTVYGPRPVTA